MKGIVRTREGFRARGRGEGEEGEGYIVKERVIVWVEDGER